MNALLGIWMVMSAEMGGKDITAMFANERMEMKQNAYSILSGNIVIDSGTLLIDENAGEVDIVGTEGPNKGKQFKCIYKMKGDRLIICYSLGDRPTAFATDASHQWVLITWTKAND
ncbi:MAG: TIGR03067 domain-containing protein [Cytophagales bacterium]